MQQLNEELLSTWLRLSNTISNNRVVTQLPYNEALICNILYNCRRDGTNQYLTATDLCEKTHMLKSQMNRTLTNLEKKGLIRKERSTKDKRLVYVFFDEENISLYEKEHQNTLRVVDNIVSKIGKEKAREVIELVGKISDIAEEILIYK